LSAWVAWCAVCPSADAVPRNPRKLLMRLK